MGGVKHIHFGICIRFFNIMKFLLPTGIVPA